MKKKIVSGIIILSMLVSCGCAATGVTSDSAAMAKGNKWIDSDLIGSITETTDVRLQDDFAAAANHDWILHSGIKGWNLNHVDIIVNNKKLDLLKELEPTDKETGELLKFADLAKDWDARAKDGVEPIRPYLEAIEKISSIDEFYAWMMDTEKNPLMLAPVDIDAPNATRFTAYPSEYMVTFDNIDFQLDSDQYRNLGDLEQLEDSNDKVSYLMNRLGYSKGDISRTLKNCYSIEKTLSGFISNVDTDHEADYTYSYDKLVKDAGAYPLDEFMKAWGFTNVKHMLGDRIYLKKVASVCTESNLEKLKAMFFVQYLIESANYLDRDTYDKFKEIDKSKSQPTPGELLSKEDKENAYFIDYIANNAVFAVMDKLYVDKYMDKEIVDELTGLTEDIIDIYRTEVFPSEEWLSDEGKKAAIEKLDAIVLNVIKPDFSALDYSSLNITSREDGGNFLKAQFDGESYLNRINAKRCGEEYDRTFWDPYDKSTSTTITNACYIAIQNSINIYAGILEDPVYHKDMIKEELYSGIGAVVGHEITHGFDSGGVCYDKDGLKHNWLPSKDSGQFDTKALSVNLYYSNIRPFAASGKYQGDQVEKEAIADMGGLKSTLTMAKHIDDFDYDKYFRHYALLWADQVYIENERDYFKNDVHPLNFLRINVGLQQFDEFLETYGIQESDGMYPSKRIAIW